jgi:hypothetical protein
MSDSQRKPFGHGKAQPAAPKPVMKKAPPPQPAFEVVDDAPDFEVVDDAADFEVVEDAPKPKKAKRSDTPPPVPKKKAARAEEPDEDDTPARKKNKKKRELDDLSKSLLRKQDEDDARRAAALKHYEWTIPSVLFAIGFILSLIAAMAASKGVSGLFTFTVLLVFVCVYVPLCIGALMVVGLLMSIDYGRLGPAILKLAAITLIVNAIWLTGDWLKAPIFLIAPISCFISYGLFMSQFDLDTSETGTSTGALNIMTFVANIILIGFIVAAEASTSGSGKGEKEPDGDDPPTERREKGPRNPNDPPVMPNEDDED